MPKFIIQTTEKKKKKTLLLARFFLFIGLLFLGIIIFSNGSGLGKVANLVLGLNALMWGISLLFRKKKEFFINITGERIEWLVYEKNRNIIAVYWSNIRWIKRENDGGISLFKDSSFSEYFSLANFSAEERKEIMRLLQEKANARQINLVNFLDMSLVVA